MLFTLDLFLDDKQVCDDFDFTTTVETSDGEQTMDDIQPSPGEFPFNGIKQP